MEGEPRIMSALGETKNNGPDRCDLQHHNLSFQEPPKAEGAVEEPHWAEGAEEVRLR